MSKDIHRNEYTRKHIKRRLYWFVLTLLVFIFFYLLYPLTIYQKNPVLSIIIGAIICGFFTLQTILNFDSIKQFLATTELNWRYWLSVFSPIFLFVIFLLDISFQHKSRKEKELKKFGIITKASLKIDSIGDFYFAYNVPIPNEKYKTFQTKHERTKPKFAIDNKAYLTYSSRNPLVFEFLHSASSIRNYTSLLGRNLYFNDIEKLIKLDSIGKSRYLDSTFLDWQYNRDSMFWENRLLNSSLKIENENHIIFKSLFQANKSFEKSFLTKVNEYSFKNETFSFKEWEINRATFQKGYYVGFEYTIKKTK